MAALWRRRNGIEWKGRQFYGSDRTSKVTTRRLRGLLRVLTLPTQCHTGYIAVGCSGNVQRVEQSNWNTEHDSNTKYIWLFKVLVKCGLLQDSIFDSLRTFPAPQLSDSYVCDWRSAQWSCQVICLIHEDGKLIADKM
jgi:hypothetical protein